MEMREERAGRLIITADDWGYSRRYDAGIAEAAQAGAIDSVSAMVLRDCDPAPLRECEVEVGLHLELAGTTRGAELLDEPRRQADAFRRLFGAPPAYIDGHHHCHAAAPLAAAVEDLALELRVPLRAAGEDHCFRLDERGIAHPDRLVGRISEREPALPRLLSEALAAETLPWGITEWMVHPGHPDPASGSDYDAGREEDLALLLRLAGDQVLRPARATHREALVAGVG
jgi:predicted glycoside hydrolase/deacetylase ChbG (UPF0249 family)